MSVELFWPKDFFPPLGGIESDTVEAPEDFGYWWHVSDCLNK